VQSSSESDSSASALKVTRCGVIYRHYISLNSITMTTLEHPYYTSMPCGYFEEVDDLLRGCHGRGPY